MEVESLISDLESGGHTFDSREYPCFSVKVMQKTKELFVYKNQKCIQKLPFEKFPPEVDFNNVDHLSSIIKTVRDRGLVGLMEEYKLA